MEKQTLTMDDGAELDVLLWRPAGTPRGVAQIAHGMSEYAARYDGFAQHLAQQGWLVVADDHRGHGQRAFDNGTLGCFPERGYHQLVDDLATIGDHVRAETPGTPWVVIGHSMGSFLVRVLASRCGHDIAGLVIIGTGDSLGVLAPIGRGLARTIICTKGENHPSTFLDKLAFGAFNRGLTPRRTAFDWLSRDEANVDAYVADPLCGQLCSAGFYHQLMLLCEAANSNIVMGATPPALPVGFFSGAMDPVGGSAVRRIAQRLRDMGVRTVDVALYPEARHEILHETNRAEVYADISAWIDTHIPSEPAQA